MFSSCTGSSPRVRGTATVQRPPVNISRFIPACAGNRAVGITINGAFAVHPRVCGEQVTDDGDMAVKPGSSPRVRGTANLLFQLQSEFRFIPACAGNRLQMMATWQLNPVHPRVCGEQPTCCSSFSPSSGSSPRVRGTEGISSLQLSKERFIPACAGNSAQMKKRDTYPPVHPRVCGEQPSGSGPPSRLTGSSPRVRGTGLQNIRRSVDRRFIPACAGNSLSIPFYPCDIAVHPRVCGEQFIYSVLSMRYCGSSPRVRGTVYLFRFIHAILRFIPACAGNSLSIPFYPCDIAVHPRVCGEQFIYSVLSMPSCGSSPRVRGTVTLVRIFC